MKKQKAFKWIAGLLSAAVLFTSEGMSCLAFAAPGGDMPAPGSMTVNTSEPFDDTINEANHDDADDSNRVNPENVSDNDTVNPEDVISDEETENPEDVVSDEKTEDVVSDEETPEDTEENPPAEDRSWKMENRRSCRRRKRRMYRTPCPKIQYP